jgi:N-acyl-D-amino-acid deacylase
VDGGAALKDVEAARASLLKDQREDGAWAQLSHMSTDAYATATALVALRRGGVEADEDAYQKGVKYLLDSQKEDGAWIVKTRSKPLQVFFDNGDPGGKSQFISFAATNWGVLAILETIPPKGAKDASKASLGR